MMKKAIYLLAIALITMSSCTEDDPPPKTGEIKTISIDASSNTTWHYYSFSSEKVIGTGEEDSSSNASWFARSDWDIAIQRYSVRTNSGDATSVGSKGGVYTCDESITFSGLEEVPEGASFETDETITKSGHGGTTYEITLSTAQVIQFKKNQDGSLVMPPVYLPSPVYIFKTADGAKNYKVNFTQYINEDGASGHVEFDVAQLL
jgi:hypothetical protein